MGHSLPRIESAHAMRSVSSRVAARRSAFTCLPTAIFVFATWLDPGGDGQHRAIAAESVPVRPGQTFTIEFPQLPPDRRGEMAKMEVRIPDTYSPYQLCPLFVWLSGGNGSHRVGAGYRIADPERFLLVGLPYPKNADDKYQETMVGDFSRIWSYHRAMLNALAQRVPNISPRHCALAGFSNGAHCIDGYLKMREPAGLFSAFILVEGGGYRSGRYASEVRGKPVLVLWGERSPHQPTGPPLAQRLGRAGMVVTGTQMKDTGHAFPAAYRDYARQWFLR